MQREMTTTDRETTERSADEELALLVLSRRLGAFRNRSASAATSRICRFLAHVAAVEVPTNERTLPAIAPELLGRKWPVAKTALKRLGCTQPEIREMYAEAVDHNGAFATLELHVVEAFFPRELWPVVAEMVWRGPGVTAQMISRALRLYGKTELPGNRNRPAGPPTRSTIDGLREDARSLMRIFVALRTDRHGCPGLEPWVSAPEVALPEVGRRGFDAPSPLPEQVRLAIAELNSRIRDQLGIHEGDDELSTLEAMSPNKVAMKKIFRPMRDRVMLILLAAVGGRVTAVSELTKSDYVRDHKGVAPDLRHGPAIRLRPGKSIALDHVRWKPIPESAARVIDAYLLVLEKGFDTHARIARNEQHNGRKPPSFTRVPDDYPLLVSNQIHFRPWHAHGIRQRCNGILPTGKRRGVKPLFPRDDVGNADLAAELRPYVGYNPHSFRHLAAQMAERAGRIWNEEHPETGGAAQAEPGLYASALLDHQPKGDPLRALYGDRGTEAAYETLSGRAIGLIWELLTTERGSRRRPDLVAIRGEAEKLRALDAHLQRNQEAFARIQAEGRMPLPPKQVFQEPPQDAGLEVITRMTHAVCVKAAESQDVLHERLDRFEDVVRRLLALMAADKAIRARREETVASLSRLAYDQDSWQIVSDSEPPGAEQVDLDLPALLAGGEMAASPRPEIEETSAVRDWLTPAELARCCEVDRSTVLRWIEGKNFPPVPGHRPWEADAAPVDTSQGPTRRRIWVPGIREGFWPTKGSREMVAELLRRWPESTLWSTGREPKPCCYAPLVLPEPSRTRLAGKGRQ